MMVIAMVMSVVMVVMVKAVSVVVEKSDNGYDLILMLQMALNLCGEVEPMPAALVLDQCCRIYL
jgi:hypothetical protein